MVFEVSAHSARRGTAVKYSGREQTNQLSSGIGAQRTRNITLNMAEVLYVYCENLILNLIETYAILLCGHFNYQFGTRDC